MDFDDSGFGSGGGGDESLFDFDKITTTTTTTTTLKTPMRMVTTMRNKNKFRNSYSRRQDSACSDGASASASASGSIGSSPSMTKRSTTEASNLDDSLSFSSSSKNKATKEEVKLPASRKRTLSSRRRLQRQHAEDEDEDDLSLTRSSASSCTTNTTAASGSIVRAITTTRVSVRRGMGSSAYAVQDAGTYQMIHDECSYLCSTILSKIIHHSKAIDAAIDLVTLLSSRKTRSILWQGGNIDGVVDDGERNDDSSLSPSKRPKKMSPIPKIWSSIFEILAMVTTSSGTFNRSISSSSSCSSSIASGGSNRAGMPPTKSRTKSARRKEKEISQTGGVAVNITDIPTNDKPTHKLTPEMKDVLACILYFVSWDCTMSPEHSVAAMGAVKSVSMARKIRSAVLERGAVLSGILRLMAPASPVPKISTLAATIATSSSRVPSSAFSHSSPSKILPTTGTIDLPISPLRQSPDRKRSLESSSNNNSPPSSPSKKAGDPTALGRRNRKKRRKLKMESGVVTDPLPSSLTINMESISEQVDVDNVNDDSKSMPPPTKRGAIQQKKQRTGRTKSSRRNVHESDELSFADKSPVHKRYSKKNVASGSQSFNGLDDESSIVSESAVDTSVFMKRTSKKIINLRSKVRIESTEAEGIVTGEGENLQKAFYLEGRCPLRQGIFPEGDCPWLSMVCLESLTRILTGKEKEGEPSCLEGEENSGTRGGEMKDDDDIREDDENNNIFMVTNRLIGKSGIIPLLATTMSQSMVVATKLVFASIDYRVDEEYWNYCLTRLKLLASLTDEACFFCEQNRRSFCEDDPFSFEEREEGLIFHILLFLRECSQCDLSQLDQKRSEVMSSALRTLTSLTHDNPLAAEQLKISNVCNASISDNRWEPTDTIRGIDVLAKLVFKLEDTKSIKTSLPSLKRSTDHDMHGYDCTLFCLTTFANIIEGSDICRMLTEIDVVLQSGSSISWLKWLCQWIVKQTNSFREEILAIGNTKASNKDTKNGGQISADERNNNSNNSNNDEDEELHKHEEEKLVAAGNGCVVLACLMTEPNDDDPESSVTIQTLIKDQMPPNKDGSSSGLTLIVNTLKAYCNYYHISMGQVSFAIIAPVKKLIEELDDIIKFEEYPQE
jgi:hypothetical protein